MDAIVSNGIGAVAVEPLAVTLGATKGSFYHHFSNRDALILATLQDWERAQTEAVIERLEMVSDPAERLRAVLAAAFADRPGGIRDAALAEAAMHPLVRPVVRRVTERRLRFFTDGYIEIGHARPEARRRALMLYQAYLGVFNGLRTGLLEMNDRELNAYGRTLLATLV